MEVFSPHGPKYTAYSVSQKSYLRFGGHLVDDTAVKNRDEEGRSMVVEHLPKFILNTTKINNKVMLYYVCISQH